MTIRLMLIDDHMLFREMAARALAGEPDVEVVGNTASVEQALRLVGDTLPDVVLLDYDLNGRSGIDFVRASRRKGFGGHILIVSAAIPDSDLRQALREGASGLVLKEESLDRLLPAIRAVADGRMWLDQTHMHLLMEAEPSINEITVRERHIMTGLLDGLSNKQIADRLKIPETTVKSGLQLLFKKTGVRTRGSLIKLVLEKHRDLVMRVGAARNVD